MKNVLFAVIVSAALACMPALASDEAADNSSADSALNLITANADEGFALAVTLARRAVTTNQPDEEVRFDQGPEYSTDADSLIAVSHTVAVYFAPVAGRRDGGQDCSTGAGRP